MVCIDNVDIAFDNVKLYILGIVVESEKADADPDIIKGSWRQCISKIVTYVLVCFKYPKGSLWR